MTRESVVVTKTVRLIAPFVLTFGLFTMFHGTVSVGGGFQGGVVVAAVVVTVAFAFGLDQAGAWLRGRTLALLATVGVVGFGLAVAGTLAVSTTALHLTALPGAKTTVYVVETIEFGVGITVAATILVMFFALSGNDAGESEEARPTEGSR